MKGWGKIEEKLNGLIESGLLLLQKVAGNLTPKGVKAYLEKKANEEKVEKESVYKKKALELKDKVTTRALVIKEKTSAKIDQAKKVDVKKIKFKHVLAALTAFILPALTKFRLWYFSLQPKTLAIAIAGGTTITLASLNIYIQGKKITETDKSSEQAELVAELERANAISRRPAHFRKEEKQFRIEGVFLPIYFTSTNSMKRLELDFTVQASNKYIRAYFNKHHYLVRDALNTEINPISVDFPLKEEGKVVVKDKIKKELNILLKKIKIEGEIQEVYIHSIFGG